MNTTATETKRYNGWANYETWAVKLWMDNDESSYHYWTEAARDLVRHPESLHYQNQFMAEDQRRVHQLSEDLKAWHEEQLPELQGFAADLMQSAFGAVEWLEIAEHLLADND